MDTSAWTTARPPPGQVLAPPPREEALSPLPPHGDFLCWRGGGRGRNKDPHSPGGKTRGAERFLHPRVGNGDARGSFPDGRLQQRCGRQISSWEAHSSTRAQPANVTPTIMNPGSCFELNCQHLEGRRSGASPLGLASKHLQQLMFHPDVPVFSCVASSGENTDQVTPVESLRWLLRDKMKAQWGGGTLLGVTLSGRFLVR